MLDRLRAWMTLFGKPSPFQSDIGDGLWVRIQADLALVLSTKRADAFFVQLLRGKAARAAPAAFVPCVRAARRLHDPFPCVKHHITVERDEWNRNRGFHVSIYDDHASRPMQLLFDMYFMTCFPENHRQRRVNPTNFRHRVVHIYMRVSGDGKRVDVSRTHPEGRCVVLMDESAFESAMFELVRRRYAKVNSSILSQAWDMHEGLMGDVRTLVEVFGHAMMPVSKDFQNGLS